MNKGEDIFFKLVDAAKETKLSEKEKLALFRTVDAYVDRNPIQVEKPAKATESSARANINQPIKSPFWVRDFEHFSIYHKFAFRAIGGFILLAIVSTGTSFAANNSLPGDVLYPVKVNINEGLKSIFLSGIKRSQYEIQRIQTRVAEVKQLASENRLSDQIQVEASDRINSHIAQVQTELDVLTKKGDLKNAFEISNDLAASLQDGNDAKVEKVISQPREKSVALKEKTENQIQALKSNDDAVLAIAQAKLDSVTKDLADVTARVGSLTVSDSANIDGTANAQSGADNQGDQTKVDVSDKILPSADGVQVTGTAAATPAATTKLQPTESDSKQNVKEDKKTSKTPVLTDEQVEKKQIDDFVAEAKDLIQKGQEKMANKDYNGAFDLFRKADDITQIIEFKLDVKDTVSMDTDLDAIDLGADIGADAAVNPTKTADDVKAGGSETNFAQIDGAVKSKN